MSNTDITLVVLIWTWQQQLVVYMHGNLALNSDMDKGDKIFIDGFVYVRSSTWIYLLAI